MLGGGDTGPTISVRGSITLTSSGRYLPSVGANQSLSLPLSYGEPPPPTACLTYTSLSSATPTLSSLLNTPSLHCSSNANTSSLSSSSRTGASHINLQQPPPLLAMNKNKNIVAANPLLAGMKPCPNFLLGSQLLSESKQIAFRPWNLKLVFPWFCICREIGSASRSSTSNLVRHFGIIPGQLHGEPRCPH